MSNPGSPDDVSIYDNTLPLELGRVAVVTTFVVMFVAPVILAKLSALIWLPLFLAAGPIAIGAWLATKYSIGSIRDPLITAVVIGIGGGLIILIGSASWAGYDFLRADGYWSAVPLGLLALGGYAGMLWCLMTRRRLTWVLILGAIGLSGAWYWAGFATYAFYNRL